MNDFSEPSDYNRPALNRHDFAILRPENRTGVAMIESQVLAVCEKTEHFTHNTKRTIGQIFISHFSEFLVVFVTLLISFRGRQNNLDGKHSHAIHYTRQHVRKIIRLTQSTGFVVDSKNSEKMKKRTLKYVASDIIKNQCLEDVLQCLCLHLLLS